MGWLEYPIISSKNNTIFIIIFSRISQKLEVLVDDADHRLGPVELVIDVPFYIGCFNEVNDVTGKGTSITMDAESNSPVICLAKCVSSDPLTRFACKYSSSSTVKLINNSQNL